MLDYLESGLERVVLYSSVSQAILACCPLPGECKMQADALGNAECLANAVGHGSTCPFPGVG